MRNRARLAGFTLIELLVAVSLLALLSVLGYRGLDSMLRGRDLLDKRTQELALLNDTWRWLGRDLKRLSPPLQTAPGTPRIKITTDTAGNPVLNLRTHSEAGATTAEVLSQYRQITYQIVDGNLQRNELQPPGSINTRALPTIVLAPAGAWEISYRNQNSNWSRLSEGSTPQAPGALKISIALFNQSVTRVFDISF